MLSFKLKYFMYHFHCRGQESCLSAFSQDGRAWQGHAKKVNHVWLISAALHSPDTLPPASFKRFSCYSSAGSPPVRPIAFAQDYCVTNNSELIPIWTYSQAYYRQASV